MMVRCPLVAVLLLIACGDDTMPGADADVDVDAGCTEARDCDDGVFCNGIELCNMGGCLAGADPCPEPLLCDDSVDRCQSPGCEFPDADGDGRDSSACGGDDCDDADATRFPGNTEVCDDRDDDCDATTLGGRDDDGDGFVDAMCCNGATCGTDCDDSNEAVGPGVPEVCNDVDDDCDLAVDEGVLRSFFPDTDGDNFGDASAMPVQACGAAAMFAENSLDCDDTMSEISPTGTELCDGIDNNCNGTVDDVAATRLACTSQFGSPPNTFFDCIAGGCVVRGCSDGYADCNGEPSDGCEVNVSNDSAHCATCGHSCGVASECTLGVCDEVVDIAAGSDTTCAVRSSGVVVCFGANTYGQLGNVSVVDSTIPVQVRSVEGVTSLAASAFGEMFGAPGDATCPFTCARGPGLVYCWGCNQFGQMGDGDPELRSLFPQPVEALPVGSARVIDLGRVVVGGAHACVEQDSAMDGLSVACWGLNQFGQIDESGDAGERTATLLAAVEPRSISAGLNHTCWLSASGSAHCIGRASEGQLGGGSGTTPVAGRNTYTDLALGQDFSCGLTDAGEVLCWGEGSAGQLGTPGDSTVPRRTALSDIVQISAGRLHACAVDTAGDVFCWGGNSAGQAGAAGGNVQNAARVAGIDDAVKVSCGLAHTCALRTDGSVWCWGNNTRGALGTGEGGARHVPMPAENLGP